MCGVVVIERLGNFGCHEVDWHHTLLISDFDLWNFLLQVYFTPAHLSSGHPSIRGFSEFRPTRSHLAIHTRLTCALLRLNISFLFLLFRHSAISRVQYSTSAGSAAPCSIPAAAAAARRLPCGARVLYPSKPSRSRYRTRTSSANSCTHGQVLY